MEQLLQKLRQVERCKLLVQLRKKMDMFIVLLEKILPYTKVKSSLMGGEKTSNKLQKIKDESLLDGKGVIVHIDNFNWLIEQVETVDKYEFALSKIMNTQCFMSNGKMQYTTVGQIAKKALEG